MARVISEGAFSSSSERKVFRQVKMGLEGEKDGGTWYILGNPAFSAMRCSCSTEADIVTIGPPGVRIIEVTHRSMEWAKENAEEVRGLAKTCRQKAAKLNTVLREYAPDVRQAGGILLLSDVAQAENISSDLDVPLFTLRDWKKAIGFGAQAELTEEEARKLFEFLKPKGVGSDEMGEGEQWMLPIDSLLEEKYVIKKQLSRERLSNLRHQVYEAEHNFRRGNVVVIHLYDLSTSSDRNAERIAERECESLKSLVRLGGKWIPEVETSYHHVKGKDELAFFAVKKPHAPSIVVRAQDQDWRIPDRVQFALATLRCVGAMHGQGVVHRNLSPETILVGKDNAPILTGFARARITDYQHSISPGLDDPDDKNSMIAPEVRRKGWGSATPETDVYSLCRSLKDLLENRDTLADSGGESSIDELVGQIDKSLKSPERNLADLEEAFCKCKIDLIKAGVITEIAIGREKYHVKESIQTGGMGATVKVQEDGVGRGIFAVKLLHRKKKGKRMLTAHHLVRDVSTSPGLVPVHRCADLEEWLPENPIAVMKWVEGKDLKVVLEDSDWRHASYEDKEKEVVLWTRKMCKALGYLHGKKLVHCDVSPKNMILSEDREIFLTDYDWVTRAGSLRTNLGYTPGFWEPGVSRAAPSNDLYSLAVSMYKMLYGELPFSEDRNGEEPDWDCLPQGDVSLRKFFERALNPDPKKRFKTTEEVLDILPTVDSSRMHSSSPRRAVRRSHLAARYWSEGEVVPFRDRDYRIVSNLGEGVFGVDFRVEETEDGENYTAKVVHEKDKGERVRQAHSLAQSVSVSHSGLAEIVDVADEWHEKEFAVLLRWIDGTLLRAWRGNLPDLIDKEGYDDGSVEKLAVRWLRKICEALYEFETRGLVHGNVCPENVVVFGKDLVLIGYDCVTNVGSEANWPDNTLFYRSPPRAKNQVTSSDDLYALAASMFHVCYGRDPFNHDGFRDQGQGINWGGSSCLLARLKDFFDTATDPDPTKRFRSVKDALALLDDFPYKAGQLVKCVPVHPPGKGGVVSVRLSDGAAGIISVETLHWNLDDVRPGESIVAKVVGIDKKNRFLNLSMILRERVGAIVKATVTDTDTANNEVCVRLPDGRDALLNRSDLAWKPPAGNMSDVVSVGDEIEAVIISSEDNILRVGMKQLDLHGLERSYPRDSRVRGKVTRFDKKGNAVLELSIGIEGTVAGTEIEWEKFVAPAARFTLGDEIDAQILNVDREARQVRLSVKRMSPDPFDSFHVGDSVRCVVEGCAPDNGVLVRIENGYPARFSYRNLHWERHKVKKGELIDAEISGINRKKRDIMLLGPRRSVQIGERLTGKVHDVTEHGVHIKLGAGRRDGFIHKANLAWRYVEKVTEIVEIGQEIEVVVLESEGNQIGLGKKQCIRDPWENCGSRYAVGQDVTGKVVCFQGRKGHGLAGHTRAVVELMEGMEEGISGWLYIGDMSWNWILDPEEVVAIGAVIVVRILAFDPSKRNMSLGLKQLTENPWKSIAQRYSIGDEFVGTVLKVGSSYVFVKLDESGTVGSFRISDGGEEILEGQEIKVEILSVHKEQEKIVIRPTQQN